MRKRIIPIICLLVVAGAVVAGLAIAATRDSVNPEGHDGYTINPDGRSGIINGTLPGYDLDTVNELRSNVRLH